MMSMMIETFPELKFESFEGDLEYLINKISESDLLNASPQVHSTSSGILSHLGIDLGRCDVYTYYNYIDIRYSEAQSQLMDSRIFKRGTDVVPFDANAVSYTHLTLPTILLV